MSTAPKRTSRSRALALIADAGPAGVAEAVMVANGITIETMVELVRAGLATATAQRVKAWRARMEIAVLRITETGRRVLERAQR